MTDNLTIFGGMAYCPASMRGDREEMTRPSYLPEAVELKFARALDRIAALEAELARLKTFIHEQYPSDHLDLVIEVQRLRARDEAAKGMANEIRRAADRLHTMKEPGYDRLREIIRRFEEMGRR
jgi:hypothetical protein